MNLIFTCYIQGSKISIKFLAIYDKQQNKNEKMIKLVFIYSTFVILTINVVPALLPIFYLIFGYPKPNLWYLPMPIASAWVEIYQNKCMTKDSKKKFFSFNSLPFDIHSPILFYVGLMPPMLCSFAYMLLVATFSIFYFSVCTYIETCIKDLSMIVSVVNKDIRKKSNAKVEYKEFIILTLDCYK